MNQPGLTAMIQLPFKLRQNYEEVYVKDTTKNKLFKPYFYKKKEILQNFKKKISTFSSAPILRTTFFRWLLLFTSLNMILWYLEYLNDEKIFFETLYKMIQCGGRNYSQII